MSMMEIEYKGKDIDCRLAVLTGADGLDAGACEVQTEDYAAMDGAAFTGARMGRRDIRLRYAVIGDPEEARANLYAVFEPKSAGELRIRTRDRTVAAQACVASVECGLWSRSQEAEVALACPDPWLYDVSTLSVAAGASGWGVRNAGASAGFVALVGRAGYLEAGGERIAWDASADLDADAVLTLDTREGRRGLYVESGGERTSYLASITEWGWPAVPHGDSEVLCDVPAGALALTRRWAGL